MKEAANTAVLVIDDEEMVRDNIEEILVPRKNVSSKAKYHPFLRSMLFFSFSLNVAAFKISSQNQNKCFIFF